jgi:hypothetical protein
MLNTVTFPSGAELSVVAGATSPEEEHHEPHDSGNPLLAVSGPTRETRLSEHFTVGELARSGAEAFETARIDPELVRCLQKLRDHVGKPVYVTSGYRPYAYNAAIYDRRGRIAPPSRHSSGQAADVRVAGMTGGEIAQAARDACGLDIGVGIGRDHAHLEVGGSDPVLEWLPPPLRAYTTGAFARRGNWVVLVAGFDYQQEGVDFAAIALNRMRLLIRRHEAAQRAANAPLGRMIQTAPRFVLFDCRSGLVRHATATARAKWTWTELARFKPVGPANYSSRTDGRHVFDTDQAGTLSITDVYEHVRGIGKTEPGSLGELSFLSHGWMGGPILVNSWDGAGAATHARDPNDKDARMWKDFVAPTTDDTSRAEFRSAFAGDGHVWVWGCAFANGPRQLMHRVLSSAKYRHAPLGRISGAEKFRLTFEREHAEAFFQYDSFFPNRGADNEYPLTFERTFAEIKAYFGRQLGTYCKAIAGAAGVPCFGALPGTYADYERGVAQPVMVIPTRKPPYADDFTRPIQLYTTYLGVHLDAEGRHYASYAP